MTGFYMKCNTGLISANLEQIQHIDPEENHLLKAKKTPQHCP